MANYSSYKKVLSDQFLDGTVVDDNFAATTAKKYSVLWIYGDPGFCTTGRCCLWTAPSGVKRATFEAWGAGGNGAGACSCNRCHHYKGSGGGYYNTKTVSVQEGWTYTICAGGVFPCFSQECVGCQGCTSFVTGCNLSNFCAIGGTNACANTNWDIGCFSEWSCCLSPGANGGDFGMGSHPGTFSGTWLCHCFYKQFHTTSAPFLSSPGVMGRVYNCWSRCGCASSPYTTGGQSATTNFCGACCGQGVTGGSGVVKVTFV